MENESEDHYTQLTPIPAYMMPKQNIPEHVLSKVNDFILISGIDFPDQIFDRFEWLDDVIDRDILLVDEKFSAEKCSLYTQATFTGIETSTMFSKYQINEEHITTVEFHSSIFKDDKENHLKIPLSVLLNPNVGAMLAFKCNNRNLDIKSGGPFRLIIPGYLTSDRYGSIFAIELTQNRNAFPVEIPVMSFLTVPKTRTVVRARDEVVLEGLAFAGLGKKVISVEYSIDSHQNWTSCFIEEAARHKGTRDLELNSRLFHFKFSLELRLIPKSTKLSIKAIDQNWVSQPLSKTENPACPYDNSCFNLLIKEHPNSQRILLYPGFQEMGHFLPDESTSKSIQSSEHLHESKQALKSHFLENVLPVQKKGVHNLQAKSNTVQRIVGGYKKRETPSEKKFDISAQTDYENDMKKEEKWRKILDKKIEIELRPVDERKRHPFHSQFLPKLDKKMKNKEKVYSREEVRQHNTVDDCWIIIREQVYDVTELVNSHPGG